MRLIRTANVAVASGVIILLVGLSGRFTGGQTVVAGKRPMVWEYKVLDTLTLGADPTRELNDAGKQGWELVSVIVSPNRTSCWYYFKRQSP